MEDNASFITYQDTDGYTHRRIFHLRDPDEETGYVTMNAFLNTYLDDIQRWIQINPWCLSPSHFIFLTVYRRNQSTGQLSDELIAPEQYFTRDDFIDSIQDGYSSFLYQIFETWQEMYQRRGDDTSTKINNCSIVFFWEDVSEDVMDHDYGYFGRRSVNTDGVVPSTQRLQYTVHDQKIVESMIESGFCLSDSFFVAMLARPFKILSHVRNEVNKQQVEKIRFRQKYGHIKDPSMMWTALQELGEYQSIKCFFINHQGQLLFTRTGVNFSLPSPDSERCHNRKEPMISSWRKNAIVIQLDTLQRHALPMIKFTSGWCWICGKVHKLVDYRCCPSDLKMCKFCRDFIQLGDHEGNESCPTCGVMKSVLCIKHHKGTCKNNRERPLRANAVEPGEAAYCTQCHIPHAKHKICYIDVGRKRTPLKSQEVWAADFESSLDLVENSTRINEVQHTPNKVVAIKLDYDTPFMEWTVFEGSTVQDLLLFVLSRNCSVQVWFHNLSGYDGRFIVHWVMNSVYTMSVTNRGTKFMEIKIEVGRNQTIIFRDSLLHMKNSLATLAKVYLGVSDQDGKQFFPYRFNNYANSNYIGPIPPIEWYDIDLKSAAERQKCITWHHEQRSNHVEFDMKKALTSYCISDTMLLARILMIYDKNMKDLNDNMSPLNHMTLPSYSLTVFLQRYYLGHKLYENAPIYPYDFAMYQRVKPCFYGGKTDVRVLLCELTPGQIEEGMEIKYLDFASLYPACMVETQFPIGEPGVLDHECPETMLPRYDVTSDFWKTDFHGVVTCDIEPTRYIHSPLLPSYQSGKLTFSLDAIVKGTFTSNMLKEALTAYGYKMTKVYFALIYDLTSNDLFKDCILGLYKRRLEAKQKAKAAGRLGDSSTQKKYEVESEQLKLQLNSLFGKFGENPEKDMLSFAKVPLDIDGSDQITVHIKKQEDKMRKKFIGKQRMFNTEFHTVWKMSWEATESAMTSALHNKQVMIAAFITAQGQIRISRVLNALGAAALYHDTDSVIFVSKPDNSNMEDLFPEFKVHPDMDLGMFKDELEEGEKMIKFVALAPKTYAYITKDAEGKLKETVKAKGFSLNYAAGKLITYGTMKQLLKHGGHRDAPQMIFREYLKGKGEFRTYEDKKVFKFSPHFLKGEYKSDWARTLPFGYMNFKSTWPEWLKQLDSMNRR